MGGVKRNRSNTTEMKFVKESTKLSSKKKRLDDPYEVLHSVLIERMTEYDQYSEEESCSSDEIRKLQDDEETVMEY